MKYNEWKKINIFNPNDDYILLRQNINVFVKNNIEPEAQMRDRNEMFDVKLFKKFGKLGLLGLIIPEEYGGSGMDPLSLVIAHEEIAYSDPGMCLSFLAHTVLCANNIAINGSYEQKKYFLPSLCSGNIIGSMALTESCCGTDVFAMQTSAKKVKHGYLINGRKMWITNGVIDNNGTPSGCVFLYAKMHNTSKISTFLVDSHAVGYSAGQVIKNKTGMRSSMTAELIFNDCFVDDNRLVGNDGEAKKHMMNNLEIERLALASISLGIAKRSLDVMKHYAWHRKSFGKSLYNFGQIQQYLADSYAEFNACRTYVYNVAKNMILSGNNNRLDSDGVKLICSKIGKNIADRAIQVLGANGYVSDYVVERLWRDSKLLEIGGGTIEAHQKNIVNDLMKNL